VDVLKHAIVGCGVISKVHAQCLRFVKGSRLVGVMDIVRERAKRLGEEFGVPWFTDREKMLKSTKPDVVHVCTPSGIHHETAVWAARNGLHCFCEKPMDITLEAMDMIEEAFKKNGARYGGCFMYRFNLPVQIMKQAVESGRFGRLTTASTQCMWWRSQEYYDSGQWRGTWELDGGGCLMNQAVHYIDLLQWLVGRPVKSVRAYTGLLAHQRIAVEDTAVAIVKFADGPLSVIHGTTAAYPGPHGTIELCGDQGNAAYDGRIIRWKFAEEHAHDQIILKTGGKPEAPQKPQGPGPASDPAALGEYHVMFTTAFEEFTTAIRMGRPNMLPPAEHRKAVEIILAIYESARRGGEEITLPLSKFDLPVPMSLSTEYRPVNPKHPPLPKAMVAFARQLGGKGAKRAIKKAAKRPGAKKVSGKAARKSVKAKNSRK